MRREEEEEEESGKNVAQHRVTFDGLKTVGQGWHRTTRYAVECSCGEVSLGEDRKTAHDSHATHLPPSTELPGR